MDYDKNHNEMDEKEMANIIKGLDDKWIDENIDALFQEKGIDFNAQRIMDKSMEKLYQKGVKNPKKRRAAYLGTALLACLVLVSSAYGTEISNVLKSFFKKSVIYDTVVDGDAFYLESPITLENGMQILNLFAASDRMEMDIVGDAEQIETMEAAFAADKDTVYFVGGVGGTSEGVCYVSFMNKTAMSYDFKPSESLHLFIGGEEYTVSLAMGEKLSQTAPYQMALDSPLAAIGAKMERQDQKTVVSFAVSFEDENLSLWSLGEQREFPQTNGYKNEEGSVISYTSNDNRREIYAVDDLGNRYELTEPEETIAYPVVNYEVEAPSKAVLTVYIAEIQARYYLQQVAEIQIPLPEEGLLTLDKELDFRIQRVLLQSIEKVSDNQYKVDYLLNTGDDPNVFIARLGDYSKDVIACETVIDGDQATSVFTVSEGIEHIVVSYQNPRFSIRGNWQIELTN